MKRIDSVSIACLFYNVNLIKLYKIYFKDITYVYSYKSSQVINITLIRFETKYETSTRLQTNITFPVHVNIPTKKNILQNTLHCIQKFKSVHIQ